ncbi:VOC family protein [Bosea caraganae]|uniref:VOC family protein n=1 Tax=Bosea caraganae TaxID=2763117 RepID=A0A370LCR2_9HYPH|nr:VOC family protein [Bosea caraganae]RDJ27698.1 VOC family protein [Bosea caraganae]RDJ29711.1 VOC family protein [Bosea caraganae]
MTTQTLRIDHAVIVTDDLDRAIADWRGRGFTVEPGGTHPRGSVNALISFADGAYIEIIAFPVPQEDFFWWRVLQSDGPGPIDLALLPEDLDAALAQAGAAGLGYNAAQDGGRKRPDGETLVWRTARPAATDLPFFCFDVTPRSLRVPAPPRHANGATGLSGISLAVSDLDVSARRWQALIGRPVTIVGPLPGLEAAAAFLDLGATRITLLAPESPGVGAVAEHLVRRGQGLFGLSFAGTGGAISSSTTSAERLADADA